MWFEIQMDIKAQQIDRYKHVCVCVLNNGKNIVAQKINTKHIIEITSTHIKQKKNSISMIFNLFFFVQGAKFAENHVDFIQTAQQKSCPV